MQDLDRSRRCLAFVRSFDDPRLQILGWSCKDGDETAARATLACALDKLMLLSAASEPKVSELFAQAELRRDFCGRKPVPSGTTIKHPDGIENAGNPRLRSRNAAR
jgi:hypothetical protein